MNIKRCLRQTGFLALLMGVVVWMGNAVAAEKIGIFERVLAASGSWDDTVAAFEQALGGSGLTLHAKWDPKTEGMTQKVRVYVLTSPTYMAAAKAMPPSTISAQILRVGIYEFGPGKKTFINMANPVPHAMVFYADTDQYGQMVAAAKAAAAEIKAVTAKVPGKPESLQLEPTREEEDYQEFNGDGPAKMMAKFKNWRDSQNLVYEEDAPESYAAAVSQVEKQLRASQDKGFGDSSGWRLITKVPVGDNATYFGITNDYTENKCIRINSDFRSDGKADEAPFPGVDHGPALPLEVLVFNGEDGVEVIQYGEMWRMQLYFWDSGYLAFAKNTLIPSIIFSSIEDALQTGEE